MAAKGHATHWAKPGGDSPLLFERGQRVWTPTGRLAKVTQYWTKASHEYSGCASIKYEDDGQTAVVKMSLLVAFQPGRAFLPKVPIAIKPIAPAHGQAARTPGAMPECGACPLRAKPKKPRAPLLPDVRQMAFSF